MEDEIVFEAILEWGIKKKVYFDSLPISNTQFDDLYSLLNNKTPPHCHIYTAIKFEQD
jgi:hypothetical protein